MEWTLRLSKYSKESLKAFKQTKFDPKNRIFEVIFEHSSIVDMNFYLESSLSNRLQRHIHAYIHTYIHVCINTYVHIRSFASGHMYCMKCMR